MRKIQFLIFQVLLFILLLTSLESSHAISSWEKYPQNPMLYSNDSWRGIYNPSVIHDTDNYLLWFEGNKGYGSRIGYTYSINGTSNWIIRNNPILQVGSNNGWESETANSNIVFNPQLNKYQMWYTSLNVSHWNIGLDRFRLRYATSSNGIDWSRLNGWSSTIGADAWASSSSWDKGGIARGISVIFKDNKYHLWYSGTDESDLTRNPFWRIGYATSTNGINWTKQNNGNPVIVPTTPWELSNVSYPNVIFEDGKYKMWYAAGLGDLPQQIVYAESADGINWIKPADKNPALTRTPGSFDSTYMASPFVMKDEGIYKMWYSGFNGNYWAIGYATKEASQGIELNVPLLKQTSEPWQSEIYNKADKWNPQDPSINAWGCAMTSAAMVLKYYGINKLPNGTDIDPGSLNQWLKDQPDGYIGKGNLNWLAISRLSKLAKTINGITNFNALEFFRTKGENKTLLTEDINKSQPDILEEPGHFIVAKGIQESTFLINDPAYNRTTLNEGYSNSFLSMRRFVPSSTDLSYIMFTVDPDINVEMKDSLGNIVGEEFMDEAITSFANPEEENSPAKILYLQKPLSGKYQIILSYTKGIYDIEFYLYDKEGNVKVVKEKGVSSINNETFIIDFNRENSDNSSSEKIVTFESLIEDIRELRSLKLMNGTIAEAMIDLVRLTQKIKKLNKPNAVFSQLNNLEKIVKINKGILIKEDAYQILMYDITYLKSHL